MRIAHSPSTPLLRAYGSLVAAIVAAMDSFAAGAMQYDDITMLAVGEFSDLSSGTETLISRSPSSRIFNTSISGLVSVLVHRTSKLRGSLGTPAELIHIF